MTLQSVLTLITNIIIRKKNIIMKIEKYNKLTNDAMKVRYIVFCKEQGLVDVPDDTDDVAVHFLLYNDDMIPVGTCRVFKEGNTYILGRLAVLKEYRGKGFGSQIVRSAEEYIRCIGGESLMLHSQCSAAPFYKALGYLEEGEPDEVQGCLHIWMKKDFNK